MKRTVIAGHLFLFILGAAGPALARPVIKLTLSGVIVKSSAHGEQDIPVGRTPAKAGEIIRFTIVAINSSHEAAFKFRPQGRVPKGMTLVLGSTHSDVPASVQYTADGVVWSAQPMTSQKTKSGASTKKAADTATYTAVRWVVSRPLVEKSPMHFSYEVRVR